MIEKAFRHQLMHHSMIMTAAIQTIFKKKKDLIAYYLRHCWIKQKFSVPIPAFQTLKKQLGFVLQLNVAVLAASALILSMYNKNITIVKTKTLTGMYQSQTHSKSNL